MKNIFAIPYMFAIGCFVVGCNKTNSPDDVYDFSSLPVVMNFKMPGITWIPDGLGDTTAYVTLDRNVRLRLPGNQTLDRYVWSMSILKMVSITEVCFTFEAQTERDAKELARQLCTKWRLPTQKLDRVRWRGGILDAGDILLCDHSRPDPVVDVTFGNSFNPDSQYPAKIQLSFSWWTEQGRLDRARAEARSHFK